MRRVKRDGVVRITDLFEKYTKRLSAPPSTVIRTFQEVVEDLYGIRIKDEQCVYTPSSRTVALSVSGPVKSEVLLKQKEILKHMKGRLGEQNIPESIV